MDPPVPIPNTEVKHFSADDSISKNRTLPIFFFTFYNLTDKKTNLQVRVMTVLIRKNAKHKNIIIIIYKK